MIRKFASRQSWFSQHFDQSFEQNAPPEKPQIWRGRVRAIAHSLSIAASVAAMLWVAPAQGTEPSPDMDESADSIGLDAASLNAASLNATENPDPVAVSQDSALVELLEASKFSSSTFQTDKIQLNSLQLETPQVSPLQPNARRSDPQLEPFQAEPAIASNAQVSSDVPANPPAMEPQPQTSAQVLVDHPTADGSPLAQASSDPLDSPPEGEMEPADLPEPEPTDLPEGEFEPIDPLEDGSPDSSGLGESRSRRRWEFTVEPYFFIPLDVEADITALGRSVTIQADLDDILNLDRAFDGGLRVDARNGRFGLLLDGFYLSVAQSGTLPVTFPAGSLARFGIPFEVEGRADASASFRQGKIDLAAYYRVVSTSLRRSPTPTNPFPFLIVDPILGLRTNISRQEIEVDEVRIGPNTIPVDREFSDSRTTLEPLVGLRVGLQLSPRWSLGLEGSVSGFDVNAERDTTFNFQAGVGYAFSRSVTLRLAYVYNSYRFRDGEGLRRSEVDLDQQGLGLRLSIRF